MIIMYKRKCVDLSTEQNINCCLKYSHLWHNSGKIGNFFFNFFYLDDLWHSFECKLWFKMFKTESFDLIYILFFLH